MPGRGAWIGVALLAVVGLYVGGYVALSLCGSRHAGIAPGAPGYEPLSPNWNFHIPWGYDRSPTLRALYRWLYIADNTWWHVQEPDTI